MKRSGEDEVVESVRQYASVWKVLAGTGFPLEWARSGLLGSTFWKEVAYAYLGYEEGFPVSAACVAVNSGSLLSGLGGHSTACAKERIWRGHGAACFAGRL
jgi:hypothetical protein